LIDESVAAEPWVLYLVECDGARLYAGITNDLSARFAAHCAGRGARFTKAFAPRRVVAASALPSRSEALKAEYALKQRPRAGKLAFLAACGTPLHAAELPTLEAVAGAGRLASAARARRAAAPE
jgi:putative endonuclease